MLPLLVTLVFTFPQLVAGAPCGRLGQACRDPFGRAGICKTNGGRTDRRGGSSFDQSPFFDECVPGDPSGRQGVGPGHGPPSFAPQRPDLGGSGRASSCGGLGSSCPLDDCNGGRGVCRTSSGLLDRTYAKGSFDENSDFDRCRCALPGTGYALVIVATLLGLAIYGAALTKGGLAEILEGQGLHHRFFTIPLAMASFYSLPSMLFTVAVGQGDDFFTIFAFTFICIILSMGTPVALASLWSTMGPKAAVALLGVFCCMPGYFALLLSVVLVAIGSAFLFGLMSLAISALRSTWVTAGSLGMELDLSRDRGALKGYFKTMAKEGLKLAMAKGLVGQLLRACNYVLQVVLVACSMGSLAGKVDSEMEDRFGSAFGTWSKPGEPTSSPAHGQAANAFAQESVGVVLKFSDLSGFLIDYSSIWTPNLIVGYVQVGVFAVAIICFSMGVVLSDVLLILAPRWRSGFLTKLLVDGVSRVLLYLLQALASASSVLLLALAWVRPIQRPQLTDTQEFFNTLTRMVGIPLTLFYVGLTVCIAGFVLYQLWSGHSGLFPSVAPWLLKKKGIEVRTIIHRGDKMPGAFFLAFVGYWPQHIMDTFEIEQRALTYGIKRRDVIRATVNALSYPLYLVPGGAVIVKLGEYLNQMPIYVEGRGFRVPEAILYVTYLAEYVLVVAASSQILSSGKGKQSGMLTAFFSLAVFRAIVAVIAGCRCCAPRESDPYAGLRQSLPENGGGGHADRSTAQGLELPSTVHQGAQGSGHANVVSAMPAGSDHARVVSVMPAPF